MDYDSMEGLEFGEYGGLAGWIDMQMLKDAAIAGGAGAGALLLGTAAIDMLQTKVDFLSSMESTNKKRVKGALQFVLGVVAGRAMYGYSREAAMGIIGGLGSVGVANIVNTFLGDKAVSLEALPEESSLLSAYSDDLDGVAALSALEATGVSASPGAFAQLADPTVTNEALMGTIVQDEQLGAYSPYLA